MMREEDRVSDTLTTGRWYPAETPVATGPIIAAIDDSLESEAAIRAAVALAQKWKIGIHIVQIVEPLPISGAHSDPLRQPLVVTTSMFAEARDNAMRRFRSLAPADMNCAIDVEYGRPSLRISEIAEETNASLIVMGLVHHGVIDRLLDGDTALETIRRARRPVLLVPETWRDLPSRALFAVDFSPGSMVAARAGLPLLSRGARAVFVHVRPEALAASEFTFPEDEYQRAADEEFSKLIGALHVPSDLTIERVKLHGRIAPVLLSFADAIDADLIVTGTEGAGFVRRTLVGSVATRLIRHSGRALLVTPPRET